MGDAHTTNKRSKKIESCSINNGCPDKPQNEKNRKIG